MSQSLRDPPFSLAMPTDWILKLKRLFPEAAQIITHVRLKPSAADVLATLSTADGTLIRRSDCLLSLSIRAQDTGRFAPASVVLDMVRVDTSPALPLGFLLEIPVMLPITRGLP